MRGSGLPLTGWRSGSDDGGEQSKLWSSVDPVERGMKPVSGRNRGTIRTVLWVVPVADLGGVARHVLDATKRGIPGWRVHVLCPEGQLADQLRGQGARVTTGKFGTEYNFVRSVRTLTRVVGELKPEIVHSHLAYADIVTAAAPLGRRVQRVSTEHGISGEEYSYQGHGFRSKTMALAHNLRCRRFDALVAVSNATRETMRKRWKVSKPIEVILNGVEHVEVDATEEPRFSDRLRILSLTRLAPEKRLHLLLEGFALFVRQHPLAQLTVAGEGPLKQELVERANALGVSENVSFPGYVDAQEAMRATDLMIQLSAWENCSYTLLDASVRNIPTIATDVGGNAEVVAYGQLLRDISPQSICEALTASPTRRNIEIANVDDMVEKISRLYDQMLES